MVVRHCQRRISYVRLWTYTYYMVIDEAFLFFLESLWWAVSIGGIFSSDRVCVCVSVSHVSCQPRPKAAESVVGFSRALGNAHFDILYFGHISHRNTVLILMNYHFETLQRVYWRNRLIQNFEFIQCSKYRWRIDRETKFIDFWILFFPQRRLQGDSCKFIRRSL